jgi:MFS family permease
MDASQRSRDSPGVAFHYRGFRFYQLGRMLSTISLQMQGVAVGWQVYSITGRPVSLGYVGLAQFLPAIVLSLVTGHVADRFDRRWVLLGCQALLGVAALGLAALARNPHPHTSFIYAALVLVGTARAFAGPAGQALMPNLVPKEHFQNAVVWNSSIWETSAMLGPALGGFAYAAFGAPTVYVMCVVFQLLALAAFASLAASARQYRAGRGFSDLVAGIRYVWQKQAILGAISLDLFAVLLGGAIALLPVFARDILHVGPHGLGLLRSAPALGSISTALFLAYRPLRQSAGKVMLIGVGLFGVATIVFGLSKSFTLSLAALAVAGAADMVSVFVRHTLIQLSTPDEMRGRVAAVSLVFVGASNELGEFESGVTAAWLGTVPAVMLGGVGTCLVVALWALLFPALRRIDRLELQESGKARGSELEAE